MPTYQPRSNELVQPPGFPEARSALSMVSPQATCEAKAAPSWILHPVDGVALASVITSGAAVIATSGVAVWTTRQSAKLARKSAQQSANLARESARENADLTRETRVQQRLGESYVEVLRIVEREGQWVEASITNWKLAVEEEAELGSARSWTAT
jgi:hypothetical protein